MVREDPGTGGSTHASASRVQVAPGERTLRIGCTTRGGITTPRRVMGTTRMGNRIEIVCTEREGMRTA